MRVKLRIKSRLEAGVEVETVALVNSGFEADAPEIVIPMRLAERLNLRSRLLEARVEPYNTVACPIRMYVLPSSIEVEVVEEDNRSPTVVCDAVILVPSKPRLSRRGRTFTQLWSVRLLNFLLLYYVLGGGWGWLRLWVKCLEG